LFNKLSSRIDQSQNIIFNGPIYNKKELAFLKLNCRYYIHGHSVGGTNPSLLEALAAGCNILIHDNDFNKDVVGQYGQTWLNQTNLENLISKNAVRFTTIDDQKKYCAERFNWKLIAEKHLELFEKLT